MPESKIELEIEGALAIIRLNRPEVLNALDQQMWTSLVETVRVIANRSDVKVCIITGVGRGFCVGADLKETAWREETQEESRRRIERNQQQLTREMLAVPIPIIAAINGYALGGGVEIALAADLRIASSDSRFGFPETTIGRFISGGASLLLPRIVGIPWAKRLIYTGEHIGANHAKMIGLVEEVVDADKLEKRSVELALQISNNAPISITLAKRILNRVSIGDIETALAFETEGLLATYSTADNERGVTAFKNRIKPKFTGA